MNSSYGYTESIVKTIIGMGAGMAFVGLACTVFAIIAMWKLFVKAGEPGWKCLIPIYNVYMMFKIAWEGKWFWYCLLVLPVCAVCAAINAGFGGVMWGVAAIFLLVVEINLSIHLARSFGKSGAFAVGLIFLSLIFYAILAFGSAVYVGNGVNSVRNVNTDNSTDKSEF